jgi:hypothetical protein
MEHLSISAVYQLFRDKNRICTLQNDTGNRFFEFAEWMRSKIKKEGNRNGVILESKVKHVPKSVILR